MRVLQYYLAGWHIKPKGVKKPCDLLSRMLNVSDLIKTDRYNPVLGEFFRCRYDYPDGTQGFYIAEQGMLFLPSPRSNSHTAVSHHPPVSAFYYISPSNRVAIIGELRPKSKFLGNSVSTTMEGESRITLLGCPDDGGELKAYSDEKE
jgi:oxysterol-binding protein-related protein 8